VKPAKCTRIIVACAVLHNLRLQSGEPTLEAGEDVEDAVPGDQLQAENDGRRVRVSEMGMKLVRHNHNLQW